MNRECFANNAPLKEKFEEMVRGIHVENYEIVLSRQNRKCKGPKMSSITWDILNDYSLIKSIYLIS